MHRPPRRSTHTNLASCVVATIFLLFVVAVILIVYFSVFKPRDPKVAVDAVRFPAFAISNGSASFTFSQQVSVKNPNHDAFMHYDSSLEILYAGTELGFTPIPAGRIEAGQTQYMVATFNIESLPVNPGATALGVGDVGVGGGVGLVEPTLQVESRMKLGGRVRVLKVFTHRVESRTTCTVVIEVSDGSVLGFHC